MTKKEGVKRTNVRLPEHVHKAIKLDALRKNTTAEQIIEKAVLLSLGLEKSVDASPIRTEQDFLDVLITKLNEITSVVEERRHSLDLEVPVSRFAARFLQALPISLNIKAFLGKSPKEEGTIAWCNQACENLTGRKLHQMKGKTIGEVLSWGPEHRSAEVMNEVHKKGYTTRMQEILIDGVLIHLEVHRFTFDVPNRASGHIGDLSFRIEDLTSALEKGHVRLPPMGLRRHSHEDAEYCTAFLESLRTVAVLKDRDQRICWYNTAFAELASLGNTKDGLGKTSSEIFGLPPTHPTPIYDNQALSSGEAHLIAEPINGKMRIAAHFPVPARNRNEYVGVLSGEPWLPLEEE
jgi:PAS domain-containing protein